MSAKKSVKRVPAPTEKVLNLFEDAPHSDINGSYTGRPKNKREIPVQDADDL